MLHEFRLCDPPEFNTGDVRVGPAEMRRLARFWQVRLGLQAWTIDVSVVRHFRMAGPEGTRLGQASWDFNRRSAIIRLVHPKDVPAGAGYDMEFTLVHELVHVMLSVANDATNLDEAGYAVAFEQPIDRLAMTLVTLRRKKRGSRKSKGTAGR